MSKPSFKPMKLRDYKRRIREHGWYLEKAGDDWTLFNQDRKTEVLNIIVTHPGGGHPAQH